MAVTPAGIPYLVLGGSRDGDQLTTPLHLFDRSDAPIRAQMWTYGANHKNWNTVWETVVEEPSDLWPGTQITPTEQRQVLVSWARLWLDWTVKGVRSSDARALFSGAAVVRGLRNDMVYPSFATSSDAVMDRFEEYGIGTSTIGKAVIGTGFAAFDEYFFDRLPNATFDHFTRGAYGYWTATGPVHRTYLLPFDARTSAFLSFRAAQVALEANPVTSDLVFDIVVFDPATSRTVVSTDVARIPAPYDPGNVYLPDGRVARRTVMRTVRVPLSCVIPPGATLDRADLTSIELRPRGSSGRYAVDDIAFAN